MSNAVESSFKVQGTSIDSVPCHVESQIKRVSFHEFLPSVNHVELARSLTNRVVNDLVDFLYSKQGAEAVTIRMEGLSISSERVNLNNDQRTSLDADLEALPHFVRPEEFGLAWKELIDGGRNAIVTPNLEEGGYNWYMNVEGAIWTRHGDTHPGFDNQGPKAPIPFMWNTGAKALATVEEFDSETRHRLAFCVPVNA